MLLASMVTTDESALICDFAETYHILDYRALPLRLAAVLASGLRDNSRIKMIMSETKVEREQMLLAAAVDRLSMLVWAKTKDAAKNRNKPKMILDILTGEKVTNDDLQTFETADEFEAARKRIIEKGG